MEIILPILGFILVVIFSLYLLVFVFLSKKASVSDRYPYDKHKTLFTPAERSFYGVLLHATKEKAIVFGKVRVGDVLKTKRGLLASERQKAFNRISAKHFDYVLCNPNDLSIMAVVELDDSSHNSKRRRERDRFLEMSCKTAQLKLYRFRVRARYSVNEVHNKLFKS